MQDDKTLLLKVDGIGEDKADKLLDHFGHGHYVAESACRYWGEIANVDGFSEEAAKSMFDRMQDASVWDTLHNMKWEALEQGHKGSDHGCGV